MHWGHAISRDLIHWDEQKLRCIPIAWGRSFREVQ
nr:hypothetical protein [Sphingobacterium sp. E70]